MESSNMTTSTYLHISYQEDTAGTISYTFEVPDYIDVDCGGLDEIIRIAQDGVTEAWDEGECNLGLSVGISWDNVEQTLEENGWELVWPGESHEIWSIWHRRTEG